jgi:hypothetical protein
MKLAQLVLDKVKELGDTQAAEYFGVSRQTIYAWKKTGKPPVTAVQKVMDEQGVDVKDDPQPPEAPALPQVTVPQFEDNEAARQRRTNIPQWQVDIETRITKLENFARSVTDPDMPTLSATRPAAPLQQVVQQPMTPVPATPPPVSVPASTTTAAPVKGWNEPYKNKSK